MDAAHPYNFKHLKYFLKYTIRSTSKFQEDLYIFKLLSVISNISIKTCFVLKSIHEMK